MIEVEKTCQPTNAQLKALLDGAELVSEKINHDVYYDYPDYRLLKKSTRFRKRNGKFELKLLITDDSDQELENESAIKEYFGIKENLEDFIQKNLVSVMDFETIRREYKKGEFIIDLDKLSFGLTVCEIELMVNSTKEIEKAEKKIIEFAQKYNIELKKLLKRGEYFKKFKPEVYQMLYGK